MDLANVPAKKLLEWTFFRSAQHLPQIPVGQGPHVGLLIVVGRGGLGDACDADDDGVPDTTDNCPLIANLDQFNSDLDAHGNACDNCPMDFNPGQEDADSHGVGDACQTP